MRVTTTRNEPASPPHGRLAFVRRLLEDAAPPPAAVVADGRRRITALTPDPQRAGAVRLELAGLRFGAVDRADAEELRLAVGTVVDDALEARLQEAADAEGALRAGLAALGRRTFARRELVRRLAGKGHAPSAVERAAERLEALGLLDDDRFARGFADRAARSGKGPARVLRDLAQRGVPRETAQAAVAAVTALVGETDDEPGDGRAAPGRALGAGGPTLEALAEARLRKLAHVDDQAARRRLHAFLARRGFAGPTVTALVRRLVAARGATSGR